MNQVKPKYQRMLLILVTLACLGSGVALAVNAFNDTLVFFLTPSMLKQTPQATGKYFRLGGRVAEKSLVSLAGRPEFLFSVTDGEATTRVRYIGVLPDLFREGQGVIAEGALNQDGVFEAEIILAKHDENYMPPEVAKALKQNGYWHERAGQTYPAPPAP